jgi:hypothetical protein
MVIPRPVGEISPNAKLDFVSAVKAPDTSRSIPRPLLFGVLAYLATYGTWLVFHWGGRGNDAQIGDLVFVPLTVLAIGVAWSTARRCSGEPRTASAWWLIGLALYGWLTLHSGYGRQLPRRTLDDRHCPVRPRRGKPNDTVRTIAFR